MKKTIGALLLLLPAVPVWGDVLNEQEALGRLWSNQVRRVVSRDNMPTAVTARMLDSELRPTLYIASMGNGGSAVVSADSDAPPLLGYSDTPIDLDNAPGAMKSLLATLSGEIERMRSDGLVGQQRVAPQRKAVAPICRATWDQAAPYNYYCPKVGDAKSMTGCVATAMAEVLYALQWPAQCNGGTETYRWDSQKTELTLDYDGFELKWDLMEPYYSGSLSSESSRATAKLMQALGYAAHMQYSPNASGAQGLQLSKGLVDHFDFDCTLQYALHDWYFQDQWEDLIYGELERGVPVYCDGADVVSNAGHAFVIDGYDGNGYFHLNWGWGGMSNGYYLLTALDPTSQGIGGSTGGYNFMQGAIVGMVKGSETKPSKRPMTFALIDDFTTTKASANAGDAVEFTGTMCNMTPVYYAEAVPSVRFFNLDTSEETFARGQQTYSGFDMYSGYSKTSVKMPTKLADGDYLITPAIQSAVTRKFYEARYIPNGSAAVPCTVTNGIFTFKTPVIADIKATDLEISGKAYPGTNITVNALVSNTTSEPYVGLVRAALFSGGGNTLEAQLAAVNMEIMPGETKDLSIPCYLPETLASPKSYRLLLFNEAGRSVCSPLTVSIKERPAEGTVQCSRIECTDTRKNSLTFSLDVENVEGYYSNPIYVVILRRSGSGNPLDYFVTNPITLDKGGKTTLTVTSTFAAGKAGTTYQAVPFYLSGNNAIEMPQSQRTTFDLAEGEYYEPETGIEEAAAAAGTYVYDLQGRRVIRPQRGKVVITEQGIKCL